MPVPTQFILNLIWREEPDYKEAAAAAAAELGPDVAPVLEELVSSEDMGLAANAVSLAALMGGLGVPALQRAAADTRPVVRVALAHGLRQMETMPDVALPLAAQLLQDEDPGVRRLALISPPADVQARLRPMIEAMAASEPVFFVRELSQQLLGTLPPPR